MFIISNGVFENHHKNKALNIKFSNTSYSCFILQMIKERIGFIIYTHERLDFPISEQHVLPTYAIWAVQKLENLNGRQYSKRAGRKGEGFCMIDVTRLNGSGVTINSDLIETVEETPDTVITLTTGKKIIVKESRQNVKNLVKLFKRECNSIE